MAKRPPPTLQKLQAWTYINTFRAIYVSFEVLQRPFVRPEGPLRAPYDEHALEGHNLWNARCIDYSIANDAHDILRHFCIEIPFSSVEALPGQALGFAIIGAAAVLGRIRQIYDRAVQSEVSGIYDTPCMAGYLPPSLALYYNNGCQCCHALIGGRTQKSATSTATKGRHATASATALK
jgi:hypothetical protein